MTTVIYHISYDKYDNRLYVFHIIQIMGTALSDIFSKAAWPADHTKPCLESFYKKTPRQSLCSEVLSADNCCQTLMTKDLSISVRFSGNI
ncbi:MAG: hypothetical protein B6245_11835 [Desulfobacteraceae bacterium 4572_88]|nr:MAG: hypothetical protein B6245_11835 [Desulfobacteraceae bacterium 4572_88]